MDFHKNQQNNYLHHKGTVQLKAIFGLKVMEFPYNDAHLLPRIILILRLSKTEWKLSKGKIFSQDQVS